MTAPTLIHQRVDEARRGENSMVIARVRSGYVVAGDRQVVPGYSLLLPDPVVDDLNAFSGEARTTFLDDMAILGDALCAVTDTFRVNYSILGNSAPALHAHVYPRYLTEPDWYRARPYWLYPLEYRDSVPFDLDRDRDWMTLVHRELERAGVASAAGPAVAVHTPTVTAPIAFSRTLRPYEAGS